MLVNIETLTALDAHIRREATGNAQGLAARIGLSRRHFFRYLEYLKDDCNLNIKYCKIRQTYYYDDHKGFVLKLGRV